MVKDSRKINKDYYTQAGSSPGLEGPLQQSKERLSREQATLRRSAKTFGEKPLAGRRTSKAPMGAAEEAEAQLRSLEGHHAHHEHHSVLERLPKPPGAAGVPQSMKSVGRARGNGHAEAEEGAPPGERGTWNIEPREEEAPYGFGIPASEDAALGGKREPFEREAGEMRHVMHERELSPMARRMLKAFPLAFRAIGDAARAIDRPIKRTLDTLQWLGHAARKPS